MPDQPADHRSSHGRRFGDRADSCDTVIGSGVEIEGQVTGTADLEMRGTIRGGLDVDGFVWLRADGRVEGDITVRNIVLEGRVNGNVTVREKAELRSSCHVEGDLMADSVAIAEGGFFEGKITTAGKSGARADVTFREKRKSSD
jgi:cytoskeletal protein CcmA (bactofilin family)